MSHNRCATKKQSGKLIPTIIDVFIELACLVLLIIHLFSIFFLSQISSTSQSASKEREERKSEA